MKNNNIQILRFVLITLVISIHTLYITDNNLYNNILIRTLCNLTMIRLGLSQMNLVNVLLLLCFFEVIKIIIDSKKELNMKLLVDIGNNTLGIYFIHYCILKIISKNKCDKYLEF